MVMMIMVVIDFEENIFILFHIFIVVLIDIDKNKYNDDNDDNPLLAQIIVPLLYRNHPLIIIMTREIIIIIKMTGHNNKVIK